jgi:hypothetical protein
MVELSGTYDLPGCHVKKCPLIGLNSAVTKYQNSAQAASTVLKPGKWNSYVSYLMVRLCIATTRPTEHAIPS